MSLKSSAERAGARLRDLQEVLQALQLTVSQDKPAHNEPVLVDWLDDAVTELTGAIEGACRQLSGILKSESRVGSLSQARDALSGAHDLLNQFTSHYLSDLADHERLTRLVRMGRERGRPWSDWVQVVKTAIARCATPLIQTHSAFLDCWRELADALARHSVSVNATNIGQQISLKKDQLQWAEKAT